MVGNENGCPAMHQLTLEAVVPEVMGGMSVHCHSIGSVMKAKKKKECSPADRTSSSKRIEALEYTARASETSCIFQCYVL
jgi:hypothetical protein